MGESRGLRLGMYKARNAVAVLTLGAGVGCMAVGALAIPAAAQGPSSVVSALQAYGSGSLTFTVTPVYSSPSGAWVTIMNPGTGFVYTSRTHVTQPLTAGTKTTIQVPFKLANGYELNGFSVVEIPATGNQSVVLAAETTPSLSPPPPIPTPPPPIPSVPPGSPGGGTSTHTVPLPKTGAGPWLEVLGTLLMLAGGLMLVLRPRRE